jgi:hypothetical protein
MHYGRIGCISLYGIGSRIRSFLAIACCECKSQSGGCQENGLFHTFQFWWLRIDLQPQKYFRPRASYTVFKRYFGIRIDYNMFTTAWQATISKKEAGKPFANNLLMDFMLSA